MKTLFFVSFVLLFAINISSQNIVEGYIIDKNTNEKIIGAEIYIPVLKKGAVSDVNGKYKITNIPKGRFKLQYSFLGYKNFIIQLNFNGANIIKDVELEQTMLQTEEVIVSGGAYNSQHENAIKIETISVKTLDQAVSTSLIKNIAKVPGIDAISKGDGIATPVIRGLSTSNILMLTNGIRMENFQFSENHPFMIDEYGISRIEFIKGPASLLYGSDAIGGVINVITEKPAPYKTVKGDISTKFNFNNKSVNSNAGVRVSRSKLFFGVRAGLSSSQDYIDGAGVQVKNSRFNQKSIKAFVGYNSSNSISKIFYQHNKMNLGLTIPPAILLINENSKEINSWYQNLSNHIIHSTNTFFFNKLKTDVNISYQSNNRKLFTNEVLDVYKAVDMRLQTIQYEIKNSYNVNDNTDIIFAFQGINQQNSNADAPDHVIPNYYMLDLSGFGLLQYKFGKLNSQIGLRYGYRNIIIPEANVEINTSDFIRINNYYNNISYSLGSTYELVESVLLRVNLASAYRSPNINELSQNGVHGTRYEKGNVNLQSQRNYELDVSTHIHLNKISFNLAGFYNKINNYIYLHPTADTSLNGLPVFEYTQANSHIYGFETSFSYSPVKWFLFNQAYSYLVGEKNDGEYLSFIPQNKIVGDINFILAKQKWFNSIKFKISNEIAFAQKNTANFETETPEYLVFDMGLFYTNTISKYIFDVNLSVNNIFNEVYYDHLSTIKPLGYNNIGRNISLGVKLSF